MKIGDYDPVECLREEVQRFKETNAFNPMLITGFYIQAAVVLDEHKQLTESNRQLREGVEAVEMENKRLSKENDRLREELEKVTAQSGSFANINDTCRSRGFQAGPSGHSTEDRVIAMAQALDKSRIALAAAKEALRLGSDYIFTSEAEHAAGKAPHIDDLKTAFDSALARIAECEKGTA